MPNLTIKIKVKDRVEAHRLINKLKYQHDLVEASFGEKSKKFNNKEEVKKFLKKHVKYS